jgi:D-glycero-D-manno-heptose 1,7-bisphosphate phosphatase
MKNKKSKIYKRKDLIKIVKSLKDKGKKIAVTNGVFDIVHAGHVDYLSRAKKMCDILIVSLNTDESVSFYKDPVRPINSEKDRAAVVAAFEFVDYVTFHSERRMRDTLIAFRPDYYIKAGDYSLTELTSQNVLKEWGGKAVIIPAVKGKSTTSTIEKIAALYNQPFSIDKNSMKKTKAIFLDRDGVINDEIEYLHEPEKFKFVSGATHGIKKMQEAGYRIIVITTQAGIGLGYFTKEDFFKVNKKMLVGLYENGIIISKIYFCPHALEENCNCRKPKTALLERAKKDLNIDLKKSFMIGDKESDIEAGKKIGAKTILVTTGHEANSKTWKTKPDFTVKNLIEASVLI